MVKLIALLLIQIGSVALAEQPVYFQSSSVRHSEGSYRGLLYVELMLQKTDDKARFCGIYYLLGAKKIPILRQWDIVNGDLFLGPDREGKIEAHSLLTAKKYGHPADLQTEIIDFVWTEPNGSFKFTFKDSAAGNFSVGGRYSPNPSPELLRYCTPMLSRDQF